MAVPHRDDLARVDAVRVEAVRSVAARTPDLDLLLLHGSRSRGEAHAGSDWDLGYLGAVDPVALLDGVAGALGTDDIDVVDLSRASALLRFEAARDGLRLAGKPETHERFVLDAVRFWCDAGPVIRRAQDDVLAGLDG